MPTATVSASASSASSLSSSSSSSSMLNEFNHCQASDLPTRLESRRRRLVMLCGGLPVTSPRRPAAAAAASSPTSPGGDMSGADAGGCAISSSNRYCEVYDADTAHFLPAPPLVCPRMYAAGASLANLKHCDTDAVWQARVLANETAAAAEAAVAAAASVGRGKAGGGFRRDESRETAAVVTQQPLDVDDDGVYVFGGWGCNTTAGTDTSASDGNGAAAGGGGGGGAGGGGGGAVSGLANQALSFSHSLSSCERFSPRLNRWELLPCPMLRGRAGAGCAVLGSYVYVCAGVETGNEVTASCERLHLPSLQVWLKAKHCLDDRTSKVLRQQPPQQQHSASASASASASLAAAAAARQLPPPPRWESVASMNIGRTDFGLVAFRGQLMAIGGDTNGSKRRTRTVEVYSPPPVDAWIILQQQQQPQKQPQPYQQQQHQQPQHQRRQTERVATPAVDDVGDSEDEEYGRDWKNGPLLPGCTSHLPPILTRCDRCYFSAAVLELPYLTLISTPSHTALQAARMSASLSQLQTLGFSDRKANLAALQESRGIVEGAVDVLARRAIKQLRQWEKAEAEQCYTTQPGRYSLPVAVAAPVGSATSMPSFHLPRRRASDTSSPPSITDDKRL